MKRITPLLLLSRKKAYYSVARPLCQPIRQPPCVCAGARRLARMALSPRQRSRLAGSICLTARTSTKPLDLQPGFPLSRAVPLRFAQLWNSIDSSEGIMDAAHGIVAQTFRQEADRILA